MPRPRSHRANLAADVHFVQLSPGPVVTWRAASGRGRGRAALPVFVVSRLEHVLAGQLGVEPGADEEGTAHLAVQRVCLLRWRGEAVFQHHRDEVVDSLGGGLAAELKGLPGGKGFSQDHHCIHVSIYHCLERMLAFSKRAHQISESCVLLNYCWGFFHVRDWHPTYGGAHLWLIPCQELHLDGLLENSVPVAFCSRTDDLQWTRDFFALLEKRAKRQIRVPKHTTQPFSKKLNH